MFLFLRGLLGPIFAKDVVEAGRQTRTYVLRSLLAAGLLVVFTAMYAEQMGGPARPSVVNRRAAEIATTILVLQYVAVWIVVPAAVCGSLAGERERGTLDLLFTTHLKDREIIAGKAGSRLAMAAITLLVPYPCLALLATMGGVSPEQTFWMEVAALAALLVVGGFAIYWSSRSQTPLRAALMTYMSLAVAFAGVPFLLFMGWAIATNGRGREPEWLYWQLYVNPFGLLMASLEPTEHRHLQLLLGEDFRLWAFVGNAAVFLALCAAAARRLRAPAGARQAWRKRLRLVFRRDKPWRRRPHAALCGRIEVANPLWLRARQAPVYDRERVVRVFGRLLLVSFAIAFTTMAFARLHNPWFSGRDFVVGVAAASGLAWLASALPLTLAAALGPIGDRRRGFLDHVLITDLEPREFFDGAVLALYEHVRGVVLWGIVPLIVLAAFRQADALFVAMAVLTYLATAAALVVGVAALSFAARGTAGAVGMGALFAVALALGGGAVFAVVLNRSDPRVPLAIFAAVAAVVAWFARRWRSFAETCAFSLALVACLGAAGCLWWKFQDGPGAGLAAMPWMWIVVGLINLNRDRLDAPFQDSDPWLWMWFQQLAILAIVAAVMRNRVIANFARVVRRSE